MALAVNVNTIIGKLLGDNLEFLNATLHKFAHLRKDFLLWTTDMSTRNDRYGTIGAMAVAALAYLDIGIMTRGRDMTVGRVDSRSFGFAQIHKELLVIELAVILVYLRNLLLQILLVSLRETTHDKQLAYTSLFLSLYKFENGVNALLLSVFNEAASIDNNNLSLYAFCIMRTLIACLFKLSHKRFAIDEILGTSHRYDIYLSFLHQFSLS